MSSFQGTSSEPTVEVQRRRGIPQCNISPMSTLLLFFLFPLWVLCGLLRPGLGVDSDPFRLRMGSFPPDGSLVGAVRMGGNCRWRRLSCRIDGWAGEMRDMSELPLEPDVVRAVL